MEEVKVKNNSQTTSDQRWSKIYDDEVKDDCKSLAW
jgi:hypothetical protein